MSGIMHKIGETLHIGGDKKEEHKPEAHKAPAPAPEHHGEGNRKAPEGHKTEEHKEGFMDKIKDKIHGGEGEGEKKGKKDKKKKEKKKHDDGHESSSSSDSD